MSNDPVSFEEAVEEEASKDDFDPGPEDELDSSVQTKTVEELYGEAESIVKSVPDYLRPDDGTEIDRPDVGGRRGSIGIDIGDLSQLDNGGLLEVIARVSIAQLSALFDIADAVEPFRNITVSGVNAINEPNIAVPVVPESDAQDIPTRTLYIRASSDNDTDIYFGDDEVEPNSGFVLKRGEFIVYEADLRAEELYMASEESGQTVQLLGVV